MNQADLNCFLAMRAKQGNKAALEKLWMINQGLVQKVVRQYPTTKSVDTDDLLQCAWFGLLEAVRRFDPERGAFTTILVWRVRCSCLDALGMRRKHVEEAVSLDTPLTDDADATTLVSMFEDETLRPVAETLEEKELRHDVAGILGQLSPEEQAVIRARYYDQMTLQRTAERLSMPITYVRQREEHALKVLRRNKVLCRWCCPDGVSFRL